MGVVATQSNATANSSSGNTSAFDGREIQLDIDLGPQGIISFNENYYIYATGMKFGNAMQNQCDVRIDNLTREQRNYILTQASPLKRPRTPINMNLSVGRQSTGKFLLFTGNVISCGLTQPPDIGVRLRSLTTNYLQGLIIGSSFAGQTSLKLIAQDLATKMGLTLDYHGPDKQIGSFAYSGSPATVGIKKLSQMGGVNAFIDNNTLHVINSNQALPGDNILISQSTGMVGIPQATDQGCIVKTMINSAIRLGGPVTVQSIMNPAVNGTYKVIKIDYEIASRQDPYWYTLECSNLAYYQGTTG